MKNFLSFLIFIPMIIVSLSMKSPRLGESDEKIKKVPNQELESIMGKDLLILTGDILGPTGIIKDLMEYEKVFLVPFLKPIIRPKWKRISGNLAFLSTGSDGSTMGLNDQNDLFILKSNKKFHKFKGMGKAISVGGKNQFCLLSKKKSIFKFNNENQKWNYIKGKADYVSCGGDGSLFIIHRKTDAKKWGIPKGSLSYLMDGTWLRLPGNGLKMIDVVNKDDVWGIKEDNSIWHWNGNYWRKMPGKMKYISAGKDGTLAGVGQDDGAYLWNGRSWINVRGVNLKSIEVIKNGYMFGLTKNGQIWKSFQSDIYEEF